MKDFILPGGEAMLVGGVGNPTDLFTLAAVKLRKTGVAVNTLAQSFGEGHRS